MLEKEVVIGETTYKVRKMTPQTACYWAAKVLGAIMTAKSFTFEQMVAEGQKFIMGMDKVEFASLQSDCLSKVVWKSPNGTWPVMDQKGDLTVTDLTAGQTMNLTIQSFFYSMSDFLDPELLATLLPGAPDLQPESVNTAGPTSFSSHPLSMDTGNNTNSGMEPTQ